MYKAVGIRIRNLRIKNGLTQMQLAQKANISYTFLGHIERGTRKMSLETFANIIQALNCSADELLNCHRIWQMDISSILELAAEKLREEKNSMGL